MNAAAQQADQPAASGPARATSLDDVARRLEAALERTKMAKSLATASFDREHNYGTRSDQVVPELLGMITWLSTELDKAQWELTCVRRASAQRRFKRTRRRLARELHEQVDAARGPAARLAGIPDRTPSAIRDDACDVLSWLDAMALVADELTERDVSP